MKNLFFTLRHSHILTSQLKKSWLARDGLAG
jgi:hypothetical protein